MTDTKQLSIKINEKLNDECVNDETIKDRRFFFSQLECLEKVLSLIGFPYYCQGGVYYFGSQSEGTTTVTSDIDSVFILDKCVVITDRKDGNVSENMYIFHIDKFSNKGYCCLRDISYSRKLDAVKELQNNFTVEYRDGYLKNTFQTIGDIPRSITEEREGPAVYYQVNGQDFNYLTGLYCTAWPFEVSNTFLLNREKLHWPSDQLLQDILLSRCFVVPKGSDTGPDSDIEWRLSFSFGERLLMFDLNIVQIRCYVLMKDIKTKLLDNVQDCKGIISTYICKTVLFHTVSQTRRSEWVEERLLINFIKCLSNLHKFIDQKNCPHFIMPLNNFLENKLNEATQSRLLEELQRIIKSNGHGLLDIKIDYFGTLLNRRNIFNNLERKDTIYHFLLSILICKMLDYNVQITDNLNKIQAFEDKRKLLEDRMKLLQQNTPVSEENKHHVIEIFVGVFSTLIGSLLASNDIKYRHELSDKAFQWFLLGMMRTDKASAHLKLASILFVIGEFDSAFILLNGIKKESYNFTEYVCQCKEITRSTTALVKFSFQSTLQKSFSEIIRRHIANCVIYLPGEINCCPKELQYEFLRAPFNEVQQEYMRNDLIYSKLFFCATIPQLPFLYFMEYKLYKQLGMTEECYQALDTLTNVPKNEHLYLNHLDTVYNLIGQCMEQEGHFNCALHYYFKSLQVEPKYNAAKFLIFFNLFNSPGRIP